MIYLQVLRSSVTYTEILDTIHLSQHLLTAFQNLFLKKQVLQQLHQQQQELQQLQRPPPLPPSPHQQQPQWQQQQRLVPMICGITKIIQNSFMDLFLLRL